MSVLRFPGSDSRVLVVTQRPTGGGGGDDMDARIAKLESDVHNIQENIGHIRDDIRELRGDSKRLLWAGIGAVGVIIVGGWVLYSKLSERTEQLVNKVNDVQVVIERIGGYLAGHHGT